MEFQNQGSNPNITMGLSKKSQRNRSPFGLLQRNKYLEYCLSILGETNKENKRKTSDWKGKNQKWSKSTLTPELSSQFADHVSLFISHCPSISTPSVTHGDNSCTHYEVRWKALVMKHLAEFQRCNLVVRLSHLPTLSHQQGGKIRDPGNKVSTVGVDQKGPGSVITTRSLGPNGEGYIT